MFHCSCPEGTTLLADLLEASESLYHRNVATIQRVFAEQYLQTLRSRQAQDPWFPMERLRSYRRALKAKQDEMIREQQDLRRQRHASIHAYIASRDSSTEAAA